MAPHQNDFAKQVDNKERRKIKARRSSGRSVWFGLGMFGLVGWSVALPTLMGVAVGIWIDSTWPSRYSWTLTCLVLGVAAGCAIAWRWVQQESQDIDKDNSMPADQKFRQQEGPEQ